MDVRDGATDRSSGTLDCRNREWQKHCTLFDLCDLRGFEDVKSSAGQGQKAGVAAL